MPQTLTLGRAETHSPLALWHLLSLDAPTVATLWLVFIARTTQTTLPVLLAPAMFLAVWIIYAADRLLDASSRAERLQARHEFHHQHRHAFTATLAAAALTLLILLLQTHLPTAYFPIGAVFVAWFAAVHLTPFRLPKELVTGLIFAAAVFAPALPHDWPFALAFALLCALNCAWINRWERSGLLRRSLPYATAALLLLALDPGPIPAAIALAAGALLVINHFRDDLHPTTLRAAADLALLTPILLLAHAR